MHAVHPREKALQMRLKGHSYNEINKALHIPKSTLAVWFRDTVLSEKARGRLSGRVRLGVLNGLIKRNKLQTHNAQIRARTIRTRAAASVTKLGLHDLTVVGAVLYWAEGYKRIKIRNGRELTSHTISFLNSDPEMIQLFVHFLEKVLHISRREIYLVMRLYPHINEIEAMHYWTDITGLSGDNFRNSTFLVTGASKGIRPFNRLPYGTLQVAVNSTQKFHELMGLIDGVKKNLARDILQALPG